MTVRVEEYCKDRHVGAPLTSIHSESSTSVTLPVAVLQYQASLDTQQLGPAWSAQERDQATELVVPLSVFSRLGKDVYAGQLVHIKTQYSGTSRHVARLVPAEAVASHIFSDAACEALQIDEQTCQTTSGQEIACISPILAFNLGLPYAVGEVTHGKDMATWLSKRNSITISVTGQYWPSDSDEHQMAEAWTPARSNKAFHAATHIGLSHIERPQKNPPFSIVDYQDNLAAAAQAMSGGPPKPAKDEVEDTEIDDLSAEQHKQRESDTMTALSEYMRSTHFVCLGDVVALQLKTTPLLGPMLTSAAEKAGGGAAAEVRSLAFLKIFELTAHQDINAHKDDVTTDAVMWKGNISVNVMTVFSCGSALPVGAEAFLLTPPRPRASAAASADLFSLPPPTLGRSAYATLQPHAELHAGKLLCGTWRDVARQFAPALHPAGKPPAPGRGAAAADAVEGWLQARAALLLTGPERGGKTMEVEAAAAALGLHVVEVDCRSLSSSSPMDEAECIMHLQNVIRSARATAPAILLLRRLERIFPNQPNVSVVRRFADTLTAASATLARPYIPEFQPLPDAETLAERDPEEPIPINDLPWAALHARNTTFLRPDGSPANPPQGFTAPRLDALFGRYPPGVVLIAATTSKPADIPTALRRVFTAEVAVPALPEAQRERVLARVLGDASALDADDLRSAAQSTAGFLPCDLGAMACDAVLSVLLDKLGDGERGSDDDVVEEVKGAVGLRAVEGTLEEVRKRTALDLGAPRIPQVAWKDVGGLEHVKKAILETIELPLKYRDLFASGIKRRSGVLLYGPPGTGKTLIAKAVATECSINFMSIKGPELINMYVGESEKNVRDVFERARKAQPCVLFFDELDSLAPRRGNGMDSSHVSDRIVAQLLAELDGIGAGRGDVYVVGATNRPDLLDSALMRPGRLDVLLYVGVDRTADAKNKVLTALTRKFSMAADVDLAALSARIPPQCTGADLYGMCADAWLQALRRRIKELTAAGRVAANSDEVHDLDDVEIQVGMADFTAAFSNLVPSLTVADLDRYDRLQQQYAPERQRAKGLGGSGGGGSGGGGSGGAASSGASSSTQGGAGSSGGGTLKLRPKLPPRRKSESHAVDV
eukprot:jgi/Ulvmu1/9482/UM052_0051.1